MPATLDRIKQEIDFREQDLTRLAPVSIEDFRVMLQGCEHFGADNSGAQLRKLVLETAARMKGASRPIDEVVGRFGGFELGIRAERRSLVHEHPRFYLKGRYTYEAGDYVQGPSLVAGLGEALADVKRCLEGARTKLLQCKQRAADLEREMARPFDHETRLTALLSRQRELDSLLDLDKGDDGAIEHQQAA